MLALGVMLLGAAGFYPILAQTTETAAPTATPAPKVDKKTQPVIGKEGQMPTAEQVAETVIYIYGQGAAGVRCLTKSGATESSVVN